ncbi:MAG TPA: redoxin domain-containing protein [Candidatus Thermoplasmatota archaeon]|nr:redoxin domain-containing protein [Candidatus Thermoplasmatota archaeon]
MLRAGDALPDFTLPIAYADGRRAPVRFADHLGRGPVVLSFFPLAFTRTCTAQMCEMRDNHDQLEAMGATFFGFSCDAAPANVAYAQREGLRHGIVSDPNREVVDLVWETTEVLGVRRVPKRGWMVVDAAGVVRATWVSDDAGVWPGLAPVRDALARLPATTA